MMVDEQLTLGHRRESHGPYRRANTPDGGTQGRPEESAKAVRHCEHGYITITMKKSLPLKH